MKEMYKGVVNSPETTITNDISNTDTLIYVLDDSRVPDDLPNLMTIGTGTNAETIKVVSKDGSAITVVRGFQGIAKSWPTGSIIARNFTEYDYNALIENINTLKADQVRIELSESAPSNPGTNTWWYEDLGETADLGGGDGGLLLGNASTEEGDDVWFDEV